MSLPTGQEKTYLEVTPVEGGGFTVHTAEPHTAELRALFEQHGIACQLHPETQSGGSELVFSREVDVAQV